VGWRRGTAVRSRGVPFVRSPAGLDQRLLLRAVAGWRSVSAPRRQIRTWAAEFLAALDRHQSVGCGPDPLPGPLARCRQPAAQCPPTGQHCDL